MASAQPSIPEYFAGKNVFITGATGFMGKVLVEKLLRCCPGVKRIYMLMRAKRGQGTKDRLEDFLKCKIFDALHASSPSSFAKLVVVPGDILVEGLGMSEADREELKVEAQVVFHCAACVRFDMPLRDAVNLNTEGTRRVLELVDEMKKLEVLLHISTSYNHCDLEVLEERVYNSEHRPSDIMDCCRWMDDELINHLEPKLMEPQPNTYAYTKALTETLVVEHEGRYPIVIARPSIVTAAYKEPLPGWVDNINGPTGVLIAGGKGVLRSMLCDDTILVDIVPVDMAVNGCILAAYRTALDRPKEVQVYNITQSAVNPISWGMAVELSRNHVKEFPSSTCLWYPGGSAKTSRLYHELAVLFCHTLPAYFVDLLLWILGHKTFMVRVQKKVSYGLSVLQYYTMKPWNFKNERFLSLRKGLSEEDDETFYIDLNVINWCSYLRDYTRGAREYCLKESPDTLPQARRLHTQLYWADTIAKCVLYGLVAYFIYYYVITKVFFKVF